MNQGKRRDAFMKIKKLNEAIMTIMSYSAPTTNTEFGTFYLQGEGRTTSVKVPNHEIRQQAMYAPTKFIGKDIIISYQDKTPHGKLRHPRFNRFVS